MLEQVFVNKQLKTLGNSLLKKPYKDDWTKDNPTYGYCYVVSEALYHYVEGEVKPYCISLGDGLTHWFVKINGKPVDLTGEQFTNKSIVIDYNKAIGKGFFKGSIQTDKGFISKRGYEIAKLLGLV